MRNIRGLKINEKFICINDTFLLPGCNVSCTKNEKIKVQDFFYTLQGKLLTIKFNDKEIKLWKHQFHSHFKKIFRFGK